MPCPFCNKIEASDVVASNDLSTAVFDGFPISPGHTLVVPRRHVADFFQLTSEEQAAMWQMVNTVKRILEDDAFNVGINVGDAAGQTVGHAHVHVVPDI
jgi:diadenosine tetraphosphate (Ap4A) HIT family hydrolase